MSVSEASAGHFDLDAELKVWTSRRSSPIHMQLSKTVSIYEMQALLAENVGR